MFRDKVVLYVNCQPVGEEPLQVVDSRIDLNGDIMIAKEADSQRTQAIDLQWMVMACDPDSVSRETCDELPVIVNIMTVSCNSLLITYFSIDSLCNLSGLSVRSPALLVPQERMDFRYDEDNEKHFQCHTDSSPDNHDRAPQVERALQVREGLRGELDLQESQGNKGSQAPLVT